MTHMDDLLIATAAWHAFPDETTDDETGDAVDDYGYPAEARKGFKVGYRAAMAEGRKAQALAWQEGYDTGKRDYSGGLRAGTSISTANPYWMAEWALESDD